MYTRGQIANGLVVVPAADVNYRVLLLSATRAQLERAIEKMTGIPGKKARILACRRALRRRGKGRR